MSKTLTWFDIVGNLHLHTVASDGTGTHAEVAAAAARAGLDFIVYTDHNIWTEDQEGWYTDPITEREILRLMGQEIHDPYRETEVNHLLCHFVTSDLNDLADRPQQLIDRVLEQDGLCFLAHPLERPGINEEAKTYNWVDWELSGFTGIELWNTMSDIKWRLRNIPRGLVGAYLPQWVISAPFPEVLAKWDALLSLDQKVVAIGNSDAHATSFTWRFFTRMIYPYEYLFRTVNTHVLLFAPLAREVNQARRQIYEALKEGHCYVSYDLVGSPRGFGFTGSSGGRQALMGDTLILQEKAKLTATSPAPAHLRLLKDGVKIAETEGQVLQWETDQPGVYRVEAYRHFWGQKRGWVFTNPIYLKAG